ncbi:MAG: hypothetical protein HQL17_07655 [Candidatus Omnitrophica bacterium]|nr:hypothetical protein [Candidatus Omnitrophota bacterium]
MYCVYVAIGQKISSVVAVVETLKKNGAMEYTTVVSASSRSTASSQFLAPFSGCAMGEEFMYNGKDVLVIYDDLSKHAQAYRQLSLLLRRPPGREAYPGDIFYLHSKMIERSCYLSKEKGGGSMTFFPIVEILEGDLTAFVPSNLVSMTDGQIFLSAQLFGEGQKPALDLGLSVSRVGSKVQWHAIKSLSGPLRLEYLQYRELLRLSKLKTSGQSEDMKQKLKRGAILTALLRQDKDSPVCQEMQVLIFYAFNKKYLNDFTIEQVNELQSQCLEYTRKNKPEMMTILRERRKLDTELEKMLDEVIKGLSAQILESTKAKAELD